MSETTQAWRTLDKPEGDVVTFVSGDRVVLAIELAWEAIQTRVGGFGSYLLIFLNPHPRPSFMFVPSVGKEPISDGIVERFGFEQTDAESLADAILSIL